MSDEVFRTLVWIVDDALDHARGVCARAQEAAQGSPDIFLFENARAALFDFKERNPAIVALRNAKNRGLT